MLTPPYSTYEQAEAAMAAAESDTVGDFGEQAWVDGFVDIVRAISLDCTPEVRDELLRRNGLSLER